VKNINKNIFVVLKINKYFNPYVYLKKQSFEIKYKPIYNFIILFFKDIWVIRTNILTHLSAENV